MASPFLPATAVYEEFSRFCSLDQARMEICRGHMSVYEARPTRCPLPRMSGPVFVVISGAFRFFRWSQRITLKSRVDFNSPWLQ